MGNNGLIFTLLTYLAFLYQNFCLDFCLCFCLYADALCPPSDLFPCPYGQFLYLWIASEPYVLVRDFFHGDDLMTVTAIDPFFKFKYFSFLFFFLNQRI